MISTIYIAFLLLTLLISLQSCYALTDPQPPIPSTEEKQKEGTAASEEKPVEQCKWGVDAGCNKGESGNNSNSSHQKQSDEPKFGIPKQITIPNNNHFTPPEGFKLTTRVYTSTEDQLSYFDDDPPPLPYLEYCAATTTTGALPLQHAYFRHLLTSTHTWEGAEFGPHTASLLITLQDDTTIELNSGASQTFDAGAVILMEDVIGGGGHKIRSSRNEEHPEVTVLLLTLLPTSRVVVGKEKSALRSACDLAPRSRSTLIDDYSEPSRTMVLTTIGFAFSSVMATFLAKVAPMWLSVVMGGGCLIAGGTYGFCKSGERLWQYLEERNYQDISLNDDDDFEDGINNNEAGEDLQNL